MLQSWMLGVLLGRVPFLLRLRRSRGLLLLLCLGRLLNRYQLLFLALLIQSCESRTATVADISSKPELLARFPSGNCVLLIVWRLLIKFRFKHGHGRNEGAFKGLLHLVRL